jgi:hypothetical protein
VLIDANGNLTPDLEHNFVGLSSDCHGLSDLQNNNVYSRARCNNSYCVYMHDYYFEKDVAIEYFFDPGHRHDWEHIVVFTKDSSRAAGLIQWVPQHVAS